MTEMSWEKVQADKVCRSVWWRRGKIFLLYVIRSLKWMLRLLPHEKDDIGRGKGRTKHRSGGKGDSGHLMDSRTVPPIRKWRTLTAELTCLNKQIHSECVSSVNMPYIHSMDVGVFNVQVLMYIKPFLLVLRTSQCAVEDMWSEHNPLLYFTSSFATEIQT